MPDEKKSIGEPRGFLLRLWTQICRRTLERKKSLSKLVRSQSLKDHFQDYCNSTSIHGIKYLGEAGRPIGERICWIFIFVVCFWLNGYLIREVWNKWNDSPVIVSFAETTTPVWNVPFPAVTICSEVKSASRLFNFTQHMMNRNESDESDEETYQKMRDITLLCDDHVILPGGDEFANKSSLEFLFEVSPPFGDTVWQCKWQDNDTSSNCSSLFSQILTKDGYCYTFNMLDKEDLFRGDPFPNQQTHGHRQLGWSLDGGYEENAPLNAYPYRAFSAGAKAGLTIHMRSRNEDRDFFCRGPVPGFKILLHNPAEIPLVAERYLRTPLNQEVVVVVQPNIMTTSPALLSYEANRRQCFFPSERYLAYFKVYTQRNCELECLTNHTRRVCGCVGHHMPRREGTKICGSAKKTCMINASVELRMNEIASSYKGTTAGSCDCMPACTSIQYNHENTQANFVSRTLPQDKVDKNSANYTVSRISIFFKDMQFTTSRRSELFGVVDFMANCGGLLGLCCGMSFLSVLELIYYITLRIWGNLEAENKKKKKSKLEEKKPEKEATEPPNTMQTIHPKNN